MLNYETYLATLTEDQQQFIAICARTDPQLSIESCPGWTLSDLALHLGGIWRWATGILLGGRPDELRSTPRAGESPDEWLRVGAHALNVALVEVGPHAAVWTFGTDVGASFWARRQAHESAMHLWDAQQAIGLADSYRSELANDAITEVFEVMMPRRRRNLDLGGGVVSFTAIDHEITWEVRWADSESSAVTIHHGPARCEASVQATREDLLLGLWGRNQSAARWKITDPGRGAAAALQAPFTP